MAPMYRSVTWDEPAVVVAPTTELIYLGAGAVPAAHYELATTMDRNGELADDNEPAGLAFRAPLSAGGLMGYSGGGKDQPTSVPGPFAFTDGQGVPLPLDDPADFAMFNAGTVVDEGLGGVGLKGPVPLRITQSEPARPAASPNSMSMMTRLFDRILGAWQWSGDKGAMVPPNASSPPMYPSAIPNALPSPGGSASTPPNTVSLSPTPVTARNTPAPWDESTDDGRVGTAGMNFYAAY